MLLPGSDRHHACPQRSRLNADGYGNNHDNADSDPYADSVDHHEYANKYAHHYTHADIDAHRDIYPDAHGESDTFNYADPDAVQHPNVDSQPDEHIDAHHYLHTNQHAHTDDYAVPIDD